MTIVFIHIDLYCTKNVCVCFFMSDGDITIFFFTLYVLPKTVTFTEDKCIAIYHCIEQRHHRQLLGSRWPLRIHYNNNI